MTGRETCRVGWAPSRFKPLNRLEDTYGNKPDDF